MRMRQNDWIVDDLNVHVQKQENVAQKVSHFKIQRAKKKSVEIICQS